MANCLEILKKVYSNYISNLGNKEDFPCKFKENIDIFLYEKWLIDEGRRLKNSLKPALDIIIILNNILLAIEYKEPEITSTKEYKNLLKHKEIIEKSVEDLLSLEKVKKHIEKITTNILGKYIYFCSLVEDNSYPFRICKKLICFVLITLSEEKFYKLLDTDPAVLMENLSQHQNFQQTEFLHIKIQEIHSKFFNKIRILLQEKFAESIKCCNNSFFSDCVELERLIESLKHKIIPPQRHQQLEQK